MNKIIGEYSRISGICGNSTLSEASGRFRVIKSIQIGINTLFEPTPRIPPLPPTLFKNEQNLKNGF